MVQVYALKKSLTSQGLKHLHEKRILHRDLKPANILVAADGRLVIGDLGLGRAMGPQTHFARTTVGTPLYFSPEICEERPYSFKSDVWALGCIMYELAALKTPFRAANQLALAKFTGPSPS